MISNNKYIITTFELGNLVDQTEDMVAKAFKDEELISLSRKRIGVPAHLVKNT